MEFYPLSFQIEPGQRKVQFGLQGKKISLQDVRVDLRGVLCEDHGSCQEIDLPVFKLERAGDGWAVVWNRELEDNIRVVVTAQAAGGQLLRSNVYLRVSEQVKAMAVPTAHLTPYQKYKQLTSMGIDGPSAREAIGKDGPEALKALDEEMEARHQ